MSTERNGLKAARAAKEKAEKIFGSDEDVNGIGITKKDDVYAVRVNLAKERKNKDELPAEIDGVPVVFRVVGLIRKQ